MLCYIYGDYFWLYQPGKLQGMLEGKMLPLRPTTQGVLLGTSVMMAVPGIMVFLSLAEAEPESLGEHHPGRDYTVIVLITMPGWAFYIFLGSVDVVLTALIVWYAWNWPKREAT